MREDSFVFENRQYWADFERTLAKLRKKSVRKLSKKELDAFFSSYNNISGHLSFARTNFNSSPVTQYLNGLVSSAHSYIYSRKTSSLKRILLFFLRGFPALILEKSTFFAVSTLLFLESLLFSFIFTLMLPDNAAAFIAPEIIESLNFSGESAREWDGAVVSSLIYTNNIRVGFLAFAFGITLGLGTAAILIQNGFMLGAIAGLAWHSGYKLDFWALILPHGVLELFAIFVCGAAGLILGYSLISPGIRTRKDAFILAGRTACRMVIGTIPLFIIAGLIEGFFTPSDLSSLAKLFFALLTLLLLLLYFLIPEVLKVFRSR